MFDLDANTTVIETHLNTIAPGIVKQTGLRIPGVWSTWEAGVRAIIGQQVSVKAAISQLNRLVAAMNEGDASICFPTPQAMRNSDFAFLKMPQSRKDTLQRFAAFYDENPDNDPTEWLAIKGIGPWTVNYAQLRGQSLPDRLLDTDLIVKKHGRTFHHSPLITFLLGEATQHFICGINRTCITLLI
jgi:AraC family transcriptional regulator of adaptative response / DNA-3-methyladenine glycosylase II